MEKFTFTNNYNVSATIGYNNADFTLLDYDGLTTAEVIPITHQGYNQYGNTVDKLGIGTRIITIRFLDNQNTMAQIYERRRLLASTFNSSVLGTLEYQNDYIDVVLDNVEVSVQPHPITRYGTLQEYEVELVAHNPWFRDKELTEVDLVYNEPQWLLYNGDVPAPWIIQYEVDSTHSITNPHLYITNQFYNFEPKVGADAYVYINGTFTYTEENPLKYFGACTAYGKKGYGDNLSQANQNQELSFNNTTWSGKNIGGYSKFIDLVPGSNYIVNGSGGGTPVSLKLKYYNQYAGV